jgi:tRNA-dihydrouridine synthase C
MPVSAKMRLGVDDPGRALECAQALVAAGACELVVHARTKADGYRPPAYWERIAEIRAALAVPVIANGEIWNVADAVRCRERSSCDALMLGRGMVSDPGLALAIRAADRGDAAAPALGWDELQPLLAAFWRLVCGHVEPRARAGRLKQWLNYLRRRHPQAELAYAAVRTLNDPRLVAERLGLVPTVDDAQRAEDREPQWLEAVP